MSAAPVPSWREELGAALVDAGVEAAAWVPDKRLAPIAEALRAGGIEPRTMTREEECVGYACGHRAAGGRPLVLFQSSGLGNALNAIASLAIPYGLGFVCVVSMRGTLGEGNPAQVPMGRVTTDILGLLGAQAFPLRRGDEIAAVAAGAAHLAFEARQVAAIVLEPELEAGS